MEMKKAFDYTGTLQIFDMKTQKYVKTGKIEAYKQFPTKANQPAIKGTITFANGYLIQKMAIALWENQPKC